MPRSRGITEAVTDPVTGFVYPGEWVAACSDDAGLASVREQALAVLTSSGTVLKRGYTTGTTAAACCKAAILSLEEEIREVDVPTPSGIRVCVPVEASRGVASCRKYSGDYPGDATAGILFIAEMYSCTRMRYRSTLERVSAASQETLPGTGKASLPSARLPCPRSLLQFTKD